MHIVTMPRLIALALLTLAPAPALAQDAAFRATTLHVVAQGETRIRPDIGSLSLGVSNEAPTAQAASQENAKRMTQVMAALRAAGIADRDIQTSGFSLNPQYRYGQGQPPERTGYQATNSVTVTIRELARAGQIMDAAMTAGANQVRGVSFRLEDPTAAQDSARQAAVKSLEAKAQLYARASGYRVVRLVSLSEAGAAPAFPALPIPPVAQGRDDVVVSGSSVAPGELTSRANLQATYELAR